MSVFPIGWSCRVFCSYTRLFLLYTRFPHGASPITHRLMTWLLQPFDLHIIHMTDPLSAKCTVNPVVNLLVTHVPMSNEYSNDIVHSHIKIAVFISMILTIFVFPLFINRNDYWIGGYRLSTYVCWCCME